MRATIPLYFVATEVLCGLASDAEVTIALRLRDSLADLSVGVLIALLWSSSPTSCSQISTCLSVASYVILLPFQVLIRLSILISFKSDSSGANRPLCFDWNLLLT